MTLDQEAQRVYENQGLDIMGHYLSDPQEIDGWSSAVPEERRNMINQHLESIKTRSVKAIGKQYFPERSQNTQESLVRKVLKIAIDNGLINCDRREKENRYRVSVKNSANVAHGRCLNSEVRSRRGKDQAGKLEENGDGIYGLDSEDHRLNGRTRAQKAGQIVYSDSMIQTASELAHSGQYNHNKGPNQGKPDWNSIATIIGDDFEKEASAKSLSTAVRRMRKRIQSQQL